MTETPEEVVATTAPAALPVAPPVTETDVDGRKKWIIVAGGTIPAGVKAAVIVVEHISDPVTTPHDPTGDAMLASPDDAGTSKLSDYPQAGDLYLRYSPDVDFGKNGKPVLTVGENVHQTGFWGFDPRNGCVHVGPAHPVFAAANIAAQRGATSIVIYGLSDRQKALLAPYFERLPREPEERYRSDVDVTFA